jgi:type IV pilus assembly protein PilX
MKFQGFPAPPRAQRGYMLVLVLVALVAMMVSGVALVRSMDTNQLVAGNLASRNATVNSADAGVLAAVAYIQSHATDGVLNGDVAASGYYAEGADQQWTTPTFWTNCTSCAITDTANNQVSWTVSRMCLKAGSATAAGNYCSSAGGSTANGGSYSSDAVNFTGSPKYFYRITVQVVDQRNSSTLSQAFVTL